MHKVKIIFIIGSLMTHKYFSAALHALIATTFLTSPSWGMKKNSDNLPREDAQRKTPALTPHPISEDTPPGPSSSSSISQRKTGVELIFEVARHLKEEKCEEALALLPSALECEDLSLLQKVSLASTVMSKCVNLKNWNAYLLSIVTSSKYTDPFLAYFSFDFLNRNGIERDNHTIRAPYLQQLLDSERDLQKRAIILSFLSHEQIFLGEYDKAIASAIAGLETMGRFENPYLPICIILHERLATAYDEMKRPESFQHAEMAIIFAILLESHANTPGKVLHTKERRGRLHHALISSLMEQEEFMLILYHVKKAQSLLAHLDDKSLVKSLSKIEATLTQLLNLDKPLATDEEMQSLKERVKKLTDEKKHREAASHMLDFFNSTPMFLEDLSAFFFDLAAIYRQAEDFQNFSYYLRSGLCFSMGMTSNSIPCANLWLAYSLHKDPNLAIIAAKLAANLEEVPKRKAELYEGISELLCRQMRFDESRAFAQKVQTFNPDVPQNPFEKILLNEGTVAFKIGKFEVAGAIFLELMNSSSDAHYKGTASRFLKKIDTALNKEREEKIKGGQQDIKEFERNAAAPPKTSSLKKEKEKSEKGKEKEKKERKKVKKVDSKSGPPANAATPQAPSSTSTAGPSSSALAQTALNINPRHQPPDDASQATASPSSVETEMEKHMNNFFEGMTLLHDRGFSNDELKEGTTFMLLLGINKGKTELSETTFLAKELKEKRNSFLMNRNNTEALKATVIRLRDMLEDLDEKHLQRQEVYRTYAEASAILGSLLIEKKQFFMAFITLQYFKARTSKDKHTLKCQSLLQKVEKKLPPDFFQLFNKEKEKEKEKEKAKTKTKTKTKEGKPRQIKKPKPIVFPDDPKEKGKEPDTSSSSEEGTLFSSAGSVQNEGPSSTLKEKAKQVVENTRNKVKVFAEEAKGTLENVPTHIRKTWEEKAKERHQHWQAEVTRRRLEADRTRHSQALIEGASGEQPHHPKLERTISSERLRAKTFTVTLIENKKLEKQVDELRDSTNTKPEAIRFREIEDQLQVDPYIGIGDPHPLTGKRAGQFARWLNKTLRITYAVKEGMVTIIQIEDYHRG